MPIQVRRAAAKQMSNSEYGRFRCIHCGDRFNLEPEEQEMYDEGWFNTDPDCCDDCNCNTTNQVWEYISDADPGL